MNIKHIYAEWIYNEKTGSQRKIFTVLHDCIQKQICHIIDMSIVFTPPHKGGAFPPELVTQG
jgi:hypothetical protein